jgi:hypothetical protein
LRRIRLFASQIVVVGVLAAAGVVTAGALAGGGSPQNTTTKNGTGGGGHNTGKGETTAAPETSEAPSTPASTPASSTSADPLRPAGIPPAKTFTPGMRSEAHITAADLRIILVGTATFLGDCLTPSAGQKPETVDTVLCYVAALAIIREALIEYGLLQDPPDPNFMQVALGVAAPLPPGGFKCPKAVRKGDCAVVAAALRKYLTALTVSAEAAGELGTTVNRFSGAVEAESLPGALLQSAARKAYVGLTVSTKAAQQAAGVALGAALRKAHLDRAPTRSRFQALVKKLSTSKGYPRQVIQRLIASKVITSAADLDAMISAVWTSPVPYVSPSRALSVPLPTSASIEYWRTTTVKDLAVLIRGLVAQKAVPAVFGDTLLNELRAVAAAPSADARKPLIAKLVTDAAALSGPAGILLAAGAGGLG